MRGRHQLTIGTHNELFRFRNLFIRDNFGVYECRRGVGEDGRVEANAVVVREEL